MATMPDHGLPSAKMYVDKVALAEAEEASKHARKHAEDEAAKRALIESLMRPSGVSDSEAIQRAVRVIENAVRNRLTQVQIFRFPNELCTDGGRAINQREAGWETTLTGIPNEIYQLWQKYFRDKGYGLRVEILDFPGGKPGDVVMTLTWG